MGEAVRRELWERGVFRGTYMYWKRVSWEVGRADVALRWWLSGTCR